MTTNPEKLWAFTWHDPECDESVGQVPDGTVAVSSQMVACFEHGRCPYENAPVQAYVREDVAAEQTAAALRGEAHELDAVRRERDALAAEAEGLRKHIAAMVDLYERATANDTDEMPDDDWAVYQAARAEMPAGKGVG